MSKYYFTTEEDRQLLEESFSNNAKLIFGFQNISRIQEFCNIFDKEVKEISVFPQGTVTEKINKDTPGNCRPDSKGNKVIIEMLGYVNATPNNYPFIKHEGTHEYCHGFVDILPKYHSKTPNSIIKKGIKLENYMGLIKETNPQTGEFVDQHYYGKMYNETMMDILSSMSINTFASTNKNSLSINDILNNNYTAWNYVTTGYSLLTSITRLTIAAFSNSGYIDYDCLIKSGKGLIDDTVVMKNKTVLRGNDFIYGIIFDPLHIDKTFDFFMGEGEYKKLCEQLDRLFHAYLNTNEVPSEDVKSIMKILPDFLNKKIAYYIKYGLIDKKDANEIIIKFNRIWNSMQSEYNATFTTKDMQEIAAKAKKYRRIA